MHHVIFIPVRLASTRLPQKAMIDIHGKPALQHLLERLKLSSRAAAIVVCTTENAEDDPLETLCEEVGVSCFRGSEEDLIQRMSDAAEEHGAESMLCVDGDDMMMDPEQVDHIAAYMDDHDVDFVRMSGLPFGANPIGLKAAALRKVCEEKDSTDTATGWGVYFEDSDAYRVVSLVADDTALMRPDVRVTLDYPEDLTFIQALFDALYDGSQPIRIRQVIDMLDQNPELMKLNDGLEGKYWKHVAENQAGA